MRLIKRKNSTSKKKERKKHVKENIKKATIELLAEKGYASVSTRDIVKRADTALGQLTYYYKTKDDLIYEVIDEIIDSFILDIEKSIENKENKENKIEILKNYFEELVVENNYSVRIMIDLISQSMYNNILSIKTSKMIDRWSTIIVNSILEERNINIEDAQIETRKFINYFLGTFISNNINNQINSAKKEKYVFKLFSNNKIEQRNINAYI